MKQRKNEAVEHHDTPDGVTEELRLAGGNNRFGEPMFRIVWGYNRIVPIHGEWQEFEQYVAKLTDRKTGYAESRLVTRLKSSIIETRMLPKYLPGNCWHLEMWRPPEEYGSPEYWDKAGTEHLGGCLTVHTAGPHQSRGDYELCHPLTDDGTTNGQPLPLVTAVVTEIVRMIVYARSRFTFQQRKSAIEQEVRRKEQGYVNQTIARMKDSMRPFAGEKFIVKP